jgi:hypothetical protein
MDGFEGQAILESSAVFSARVSDSNEEGRLGYMLTVDSGEYRGVFQQGSIG